jgi:Bacterial membrane protein YfhO
LPNLAWLLVGIVSAAGAYAARKHLPLRVAALFALLVASFLWRPLTQRVTIVPVDVLNLLPPWSELRAPNRPPVTKYDVSNLNLHDLPMQVVPWMHQVRESWRAGRVPLWNDAAGCGYPLMANGQSTPFSPFVLLTLPLPLDFAIAAQAALKLLLALTLTFLFCRRRYSLLGSTIAALAYAFSTWMVTWLQFPIATAAAFLPGVLMGIEDLLERRRFTLPVVTFVLTVLSGHPETVFNIGIIAAAYGLWTARSFKALLNVIAACLVAACICAPYLVPFAEAVTRSQRFAEVGTWEAAVPFSDRASAALLLQPRFFGHLPIERPWGPTTLESICGFAGVLSIAAVLAAAIIVVRKRAWRSPETLFVLGAILCLGIVLGWPGITQLFHAVAGFAPAMRMRLGLCWFAAVLIAFAIDHRDSRVPLLAGALGVALLMLFFLRTTPFPSDSQHISALLSLLPSMAVLLALIHRRLIVAAGALTMVELWLTMAHWNPILPLRTLETPLLAKLKTLDGRIVGLGGHTYPNVGAFWGIEDVRVHDPMAFDPYVTYLERNAGWNRADYYAKWTDPNSPLLDRLGVRWIVSDRELEGRPLVYAGRDGFIYGNLTAKPLFFSDAASVTFDGTRVHVKATLHALVKSSIPHYPGWRASVPLFANDGPFLAFMVPPGTHAIEVAYRPRSFYLSLIPAAIATAALLVRMRRRRARR